MNEPSGAARLVSPEAARCSSCTCALADSSIAHRSVFRPAGRQPAILRAMQCSAVQCSAVQCFAIAAAIQLHTSMRQSVCVRRISGGPPRAPIKCHFNCFGGARVRRSPLPLCCCARPALSFNARVGRLPFSVAASRSETRASRVEWRQSVSLFERRRLCCSTRAVRPATRLAFAEHSSRLRRRRRRRRATAPHVQYMYLYSTVLRSTLL